MEIGGTVRATLVVFGSASELTSILPIEVGNLEHGVDLGSSVLGIIKKGVTAWRGRDKPSKGLGQPCVIGATR
jgi:hypothetical protein